MNAAAPGRLVVVSNRVPVPDRSGAPPAGGLAVAVHAAMKQSGGLWMGWSGKSVDEAAAGRIQTRRQGAITYCLMDLSHEAVDEYYNGFANRMLWPVFHGRVDLAEYTRRERSGYFAVNRLFADRLVPLVRPDDMIWIHDYHLIPLAAELRERGVRNRIGFFLHISFPPADVLLTMPGAEVFLRALSAYDLIGFQTDHDLQNFLGCLAREGFSGTADASGMVEAWGRRFRVGCFPIGMETEEFARIAADSTGEKKVASLVRSLNGRKLLIGVDRLDYSKGIPQRLLAFERFLAAHPEAKRAVTYVQVTPKSRSDVPEYRAMQDEVAALAGRINGAEGALDWTPIRYLNQSLKRPVLAGLYRVARVGLVTPLRDGMNLVAKEYVAAQDPEDPGVLVLSRFAGAARELSEALIVNPYDIDSVASAIARAISMPLDERKARWQPMMERLLDYDVVAWCHDFLARLDEPTGGLAERGLPLRQIVVDAEAARTPPVRTAPSATGVRICPGPAGKG